MTNDEYARLKYDIGSISPLNYSQVSGHDC